MADVSAIREVDCEHCGMVFLMRKAVVLDASRDYRYFCSRGCAQMWKKASGAAAREIPLRDVPGPE